MPTTEETRRRNRSRLIMPAVKLVEPDYTAEPDEPVLDTSLGRSNFFGRKLTTGLQRALIDHPFDAEAWMAVDRQEANRAAALDEAAAGQPEGLTGSRAGPRPPETAATPAGPPLVPFSPLREAIETGQPMPPGRMGPIGPIGPMQGALTAGTSAPPAAFPQQTIPSGLEPLAPPANLLSPAEWAKEFYPEYASRPTLKRREIAALDAAYDSYVQLEALKENRQLNRAQENRLRGESRLQGAIQLGRGRGTKQESLPSTAEGAYVQGVLQGKSDEELEPFRRILDARLGGARDTVETKARDEAAEFLASNSNLDPMQRYAYLKNPSLLLPADQKEPVLPEVEVGLTAQRDPSWMPASTLVQDVGAWWKAVQTQRAGPPLNLRDQATVAKRIRDTAPQVTAVIEAGRSGEITPEELIEVLTLLAQFDPDGVTQAVDDGLITQEQLQQIAERMGP